MKLLNLVVIVLIFNLDWSTAACPPSEVVRPCDCSYDSWFNGNFLSCVGNITLKSVLKKISDNVKANERHFYRLLIRDSLAEEIESYVIANLTFDTIRIDYCPNLKKIHSQAFNNTATRIKQFNLYDLKKYSHSPAPYNFFDMINTFVNIKEFESGYVNITNITSEAFGPLPKLNTIKIVNTYLYRQDMAISDRAFYNLDNLTELILIHRIPYIPKDAFKFRRESNQTLRLILYENRFNSSTFSTGWLNNFNRKVVIGLQNNRIATLDRNVFEPFLNDTRNNLIMNLQGNPLNCSDCRNAWLKKAQDKYKSRVIGASCDGGWRNPTIFDSNFYHCP